MDYNTVEEVSCLQPALLPVVVRIRCLSFHVYLKDKYAIAQFLCIIELI